MNRIETLKYANTMSAHVMFTSEETKVEFVKNFKSIFINLFNLFHRIKETGENKFIKHTPIVYGEDKWIESKT